MASYEAIKLLGVQSTEYQNIELGCCGELQLATRQPPDVSDKCRIYYGSLHRYYMN